MGRRGNGKAGSAWMWVVVVVGVIIIEAPAVRAVWYFGNYGLDDTCRLGNVVQVSAWEEGCIPLGETLSIFSECINGKLVGNAYSSPDCSGEPQFSQGEDRCELDDSGLFYYSASCSLYDFPGTYSTLRIFEDSQCDEIGFAVANRLDMCIVRTLDRGSLYYTCEDGEYTTQACTDKACSENCETTVEVLPDEECIPNYIGDQYGDQQCGGIRTILVSGAPSLSPLILTTMLGLLVPQSTFSF
mmetsp:Transcript_23583/g.66181  ORF Transcript_23583/g.66181 Transcript_23583/m.66181 type:complete len:243 (+) Transcript_23583:52-780(+)